MLTNLSVPHDLCFCMRQPNFTSRVGAFSVIVKSLRRFVASSRVPSAVCSGCRVVVFVFDPLIRCVISARVSRPAPPAPPAQPAQPAQPAPGNQNTENNSFVRPLHRCGPTLLLIQYHPSSNVIYHLSTSSISTTISPVLTTEAFVRYHNYLHNTSKLICIVVKLWSTAYIISIF